MTRAWRVCILILIFYLLFGRPLGHVWLVAVIWAGIVDVVLWVWHSL